MSAAKNNYVNTKQPTCKNVPFTRFISVQHLHLHPLAEGAVVEVVIHSADKALSFYSF